MAKLAVPSVDAGARFALASLGCSPRLQIARCRKVFANVGANLALTCVANLATYARRGSLCQSIDSRAANLAKRSRAPLQTQTLRLHLMVRQLGEAPRL